MLASHFFKYKICSQLSNIIIKLILFCNCSQLNLSMRRIALRKHIPNRWYVSKHIIMMMSTYVALAHMNGNAGETGWFLINNHTTDTTDRLVSYMSLFIRSCRPHGSHMNIAEQWEIDILNVGVAVSKNNANGFVFRKAKTSSTDLNHTKPTELNGRQICNICINFHVSRWPRNVQIKHTHRVNRLIV